jgi:hypothetical protein
MADLGRPLPPIIFLQRPSLILCNFLFHHLDRVNTLLPPVDIIYPLLFTSRLNSMHTVVLTIPHLNPTMLLPTSQSVLLYPFLVHVKYEINVPLVFVWRLVMRVFLWTEHNL